MVARAHLTARRFVTSVPDRSQGVAGFRLSQDEPSLRRQAKVGLCSLGEFFYGSRTAGGQSIKISLDVSGSRGGQIPAEVGQNQPRLRAPLSFCVVPRRLAELDVRNLLDDLLVCDLQRYVVFKVNGLRRWPCHAGD
jgi:hypothetical protein